MINVYRANTRGNKNLTKFVLGLALVFLVILAVSFFAYIGTLSQKNKSLKSADFSYKRIIVQKGDTLWELASQVNQSVEINTLVHKTIAYNNLSSTYIQPGQVIYIPVKHHM